MNEEDIEILERFSTIQRTGDMQFININYKELKQAIENLINRVKELEEELDRQINAREIEEKYVEENFITRAEVKEGLDKQDELLKKYYTPKSKIKEKIEEVEDSYTDEVGLDIDAMYHNQFIIDCVAILEELLEE